MFDINSAKDSAELIINGALECKISLISWNSPIKRVISKLPVNKIIPDNKTTTNIAELKINS